jgi:hypothetical protein
MVSITNYQHLDSFNASYYEVLSERQNQLALVFLATNAAPDSER